MTTIGKGQSADNQLYWVADNTIASDFPNVDSALRDPDGLLAIGGDLSRERLLNAYKKGIFPWYSEGQPILWWSPDPRCILEPANIRISRSLARVIRKDRFYITYNNAFEEVMRACARPRNTNTGTWITDAMLQAYLDLYRTGHGISVECWHDSKLVGGLYGVAIGRIFFGESMFSLMDNASKVALVHLAGTVDKLGFRLIDCQIYSSHLHSLGARPMQRELFINILRTYCSADDPVHWPQQSSRS